MAVLNAAIVVESDRVPFWQYRAVARLLESEHVRLRTILLLAPSARSQRSWKTLAWKLCAWFGGARHGRRSVTDLAADALVLHVEGLLPTAAQHTALEELDFVLRLTPYENEIPKALARARYGVWSLRFGGAGSQGLPPGMLETYHGCETTTVTLVRETGRADAREVLRWARQRTRPSCFRNSRELLLRASELPRLAVLDLVNGTATSRYPDKAAALPLPRIFPLSRILARSAFRFLRRGLELTLFDEHWSILIFRNQGFPAKDFFRRENALAEVRFPSWVGYGADPFIVEDGNRLYLLFEYFREGMGRIDVAVLDENMRLVDYTENLVPSHVHQSYPFVMKTPKGWLVVPEAGASGAVPYHLLDELDGAARESGTLIENFAGVDNTICFHAGKYWMFNSRATQGLDHETELMLWWAEDPQGPWVAHPANPVQIDVAGSRPAGPLFTDEQGVLYRPAQDGSAGYGSGLVLKRVHALDEQRFEERTLLKVEPRDVTPGAIGVHHFCASERYVAVDYRLRRLKPRLLAYLIGRLKGEDASVLVRVGEKCARKSRERLQPATVAPVRPVRRSAWPEPAVARCSEANVAVAVTASRLRLPKVR